MLGRALGDIVGGFDSLRQDSESCSCWQALTTALADGTRTECTFTVRVEGTPKTYLAMISPERLGSESSEYADVVFVHISQCLDRFHSLKHASINKERFMGIVAHELRNPLSAIASGLKILAVSPSGADTLQVREMMERQVVQLSRLVHDLLDMSRINEAKLTLTKSRGLLREILSLAIDTAQGSIKKGKHELRVHVPDEPIELCVDSSRIAQVISNLLDNSSKYTAPGGVIILQVVHSPKELVISVRDNGVGIAPENRERIFQQFMQVDRERRRSRGGLGLGLYLVKMIVEAHGGSIEAVSNGEGHGSEFVVRLPV
jgi:signal transduction histidine kinase